MQKFSVSWNFREDEDMEGERIGNERRKYRIFISLSLLETLYNNNKKK